jgi:hypothetical protein
VDATAGHDATAQRGDPKRPFQTLSNAIAVLRNGDRLLLRQGTYRVHASNYSREETEVISPELYFLNLTNIEVVAHEPVLISGTNYGNVITCENVDDLRFIGLALSDASAGLTDLSEIAGLVNFRGTNHRVEFAYCAFTNAPDQGITQIGGARQTHDVRIHHCYFSEVGSTNLPRFGFPDGACVSGLMRHLTFHDNLIERSHAYVVEMDAGGLDFQGLVPGPVVTNNLVLDFTRFVVVLFGNTNGTLLQGSLIAHNQIIARNTSVEKQDAFAVKGGLDTVIRDNYVELRAHTDPDFQNAAIYLAPDVGGITNVTIRGNHFVGGYSALRLPNGPQAYGISGVQFIGNTLLDIGRHGLQVAGADWTIAHNLFGRCDTNGQAACAVFVNAFNSGVPHGPSNLVIRANVFDDPAGDMDGAIWLYGGTNVSLCTQVTILDNAFGRCGLPLFISDDAGNPIPHEGSIVFNPQPRHGIVWSAYGAALRLTGLPGQSYVMQRSAGMDSTWQSVGVVQASEDGMIEFLDSLPLARQAFYRLLWP